MPGTLRFAQAAPIDADAAAEVALLRRIASGDVEAHRQLYERHAAASTPSPEPSGTTERPGPETRLYLPVAMRVQ
ncbi:MAG: hypothetical protein IT332_04885 [Ardenticatenales bacterium]|nr:hypothetical protein [Ardenticatenales bacterium]